VLTVPYPGCGGTTVAGSSSVLVMDSWKIFGFSLAVKTMQRCRNEPHLEQETMCFFLVDFEKTMTHTHTQRLVI
jgi:hypothetical protein